MYLGNISEFFEVMDFARVKGSVRFLHLGDPKSGCKNKGAQTLVEGLGT